MADSEDHGPSEIVPSFDGSIAEGTADLAFGLPLNEAGSPPGHLKGLWKLLRFIGAVTKQFCVSGVRYAHGKAEEPLARVQNIESQISDRYEESRRRQEKHVLEMERLRLAVEKDQYDLARAKSLAEAEGLLREQAEADVQFHVKKLAELGISVDLVPGEVPRVGHRNAEVNVHDLELSVRTRKALLRTNITTLGELSAHTEDDLLAQNFGTGSLEELRHGLVAHGMAFRRSEQH